MATFAINIRGHELPAVSVRHRSNLEVRLQNIQLPIQALSKLEFIVRNESEPRNDV